MMSYYTIGVVELCIKGLLGCQSQNHSNTIGLLSNEHHQVTGLRIYNTIPSFVFTQHSQSAFVVLGIEPRFMSVRQALYH